MCFASPPKPKDPAMPVEYAAQKSPDGGAARDAVTGRQQDKTRAAANTVLTSGSGVLDAAPTAKKTLLGQ